MTLSIERLRSEDWRQFDQLGEAFATSSRDVPMEIRSLDGWPFAWLLHPEVRDGLAVADTRVLHRLHEAGLIDVQTSMAQPNRQHVISLTLLGLDVSAQRTLWGPDPKP